MQLFLHFVNFFFTEAPNLRTLPISPAPPALLRKNRLSSAPFSGEANYIKYF